MVEIKNRHTSDVIFKHAGDTLSEANLSKADLSGADLSRANLSEANLSEANLSDWSQYKRPNENP